MLAQLAGRADHIDALLARLRRRGERRDSPPPRASARSSGALPSCRPSWRLRRRRGRPRGRSARRRRKATALEIEHAQLDERLSELRRRARELAEQHELSIVDAVEPLAAEEVTGLSAKLERLERRRAELGAVNPLAREQYEEERARSEDVTTQIADLQRAVGELDGLIADLSSTIDERFTATYSQVERGFAEAIEILFPGGRGG